MASKTTQVTRTVGYFALISLALAGLLECALKPKAGVRNCWEDSAGVVHCRPATGRAHK